MRIAYHQPAHICNPVKTIPSPSVMQEENVRNDLRLYGFSRSGRETIEHTSSHETAIRLSACTPDCRADVNKLAENHDWTPAERCAKRYP